MSSLKGDFANVTEMTGLMLNRIGFRSRRLRDFICGLQGVAGARVEFDCTHPHLARRLDHNGKQEAATTFVSRYLDALEKEQRRVGKMLFRIDRGGGRERRPTHYVDFVTPCAVWAVEKARRSELWQESHSRALEAFAEAAVEMLPSIEKGSGEVKTNSYLTPVKVRIARNKRHAITRVCANFNLILEAHGDVIAHAQEISDELLKRARLITQNQEVSDEVEVEGDQFCTPSASDEGDQFCTPSNVSNPENTEENPLALAALSYAGDAIPTQICIGSETAEQEKAEEKPDMLAAALSYARRGWRVFPLHWPKAQGICSCQAGANCKDVGKHPRIIEWQKLASTDEKMIKGWWRKWPDANIGIATGAESRLIAIDVDFRHGGDVSLAQLFEPHGEIPETLEAKTGGGFHLLFEHPGIPIQNSAGKLGEGLDARGDGGYIVASPSLHASGKRYRWRNDHAPAPVPEWLLKRLTEEKRKVAAAPAAQTRPQAKSGAATGSLIPEGQRNTKLRDVARAMRGQDYNFDEILAGLTRFRDTRCHQGITHPVTGDELLKIAQRVMRFPSNAEKAKQAAVGA